MIRSPLLRRTTASLLACALLASCSAPEDDTKADTKAGADASAAKEAAPAAQGGRFSRAVQNLATTKVVTCQGNGFFPADSAAFTTDSTIATNDTTFNVPGGHALYLPMNAVPAGTKFVVTQPMPDTAALDIEPTLPAAQYDTLVSLTVNYAACVPATDTGHKTLFRDSATHLHPVGNANRNKKVTAWLEHFSTYIVGGN